MMWLAGPYLLVLSMLLKVTGSQYSERECPCNASGIWLDLVALVDNSLFMSQQGLFRVDETMSAVLQELPISQEIGQNTRVSIIRYDTRASPLGDLHSFNTTQEIICTLCSITVSDVNEVDIRTALIAASQVLMDSHDRPNVPTAIILFASAYSPVSVLDPGLVAKQLKDAGTTIITVNMAETDMTNIAGRIAALASPGLAFNYTDVKLVDEIISALCEANCFCPTDWIQLRNSTQKFGECVYLVDDPCLWPDAADNCKALIDNGFLVQEFSKFKLDFVNDNLLFDNDANIGLSKQDGEEDFTWESADGSKIPLGTFQPWNPEDDQEGDAVLTDGRTWWSENSLESCEQYVCQTISCDSENYCEDTWQPGPLNSCDDCDCDDECKKRAKINNIRG